MPITPPSGSSLHKFTEEQVRRIRADLIDRLKIVGEKTVSYARKNHGDAQAKKDKTEGNTTGKYINQTGNLTSSIGFSVVDRGNVVVKSSFEQHLNGSEGAKAGEQYLEEVSALQIGGLSLVLVAGMDYAEYVEKMGLDVLDSSKLVAREELKKQLTALAKYASIQFSQNG